MQRETILTVESSTHSPRRMGKRRLQTATFTTAKVDKKVVRLKELGNASPDMELSLIIRAGHQSREEPTLH